MNPHLSERSITARSLSKTLLMGLGGSLACHAAVIGAIGYWLPVAPVDELEGKEITQIERVNLDPQPVPQPIASPTVKVTTPPEIAPKSPPIKIAAPLKVSKPKPAPTRITPPIIASKPTPIKITPPIRASKPPNRSQPTTSATKPLAGKIEPPNSPPPPFPDRLFNAPIPTSVATQKSIEPQRQQPRQVKIVRQTTRPRTTPVERTPAPTLSPSLTPSPIAPIAKAPSQERGLVSPEARLRHRVASPLGNRVPDRTRSPIEDAKPDPSKVTPPAAKDLPPNLPPPTITDKELTAKSRTPDSPQGRLRVGVASPLAIRAKPVGNNRSGTNPDPQIERAAPADTTAATGNSPTPAQFSNTAPPGTVRALGSGSGGDRNSSGQASGNSGSKSNPASNGGKTVGSSQIQGGIQCLQNCEIRYPDNIPDAQTGKDKILVRVSVDANGAITQAEIARSSDNPQLDSFVLEKVKQMQLKPLGQALTFRIKVNAFNNN